MASKDLHKDADVKQQQVWECTYSPLPPVGSRGEQRVHLSRHNAGEVVATQPQIDVCFKCAELRWNLAGQHVVVEPPIFVIYFLNSFILVDKA